MASNFRREDHALFVIRAHAIYHRRFHVVWVTKYRYAVLQGPMRERIRQIFRQTCEEMGVHILRGVLARDHVHMFLSIPPKLSLSDVMQRIKGRSSRRIQMEFPELRNRYWGRRFWAREYFSTTSGNVTDDIIMQYLELHSAK
jgi:putative transposase